MTRLFLHCKTVGPVRLCWSVAVYMSIWVWECTWVLECGCVHEYWSVAVYMSIGVWLCTWILECGCVHGYWSVTVYISIGVWLCTWVLECGYVHEYWSVAVYMSIGRPCTCTMMCCSPLPLCWLCFYSNSQMRGTFLSFSRRLYSMSFLVPFMNPSTISSTTVTCSMWV